MIPTVHISTALLLASTEEYAAVDRRMLRELGIRELKILTSGAEGARLLRTTGTLAFRPEAIFCAEILADMPGVDFLDLIRLHPDLTETPVLLLTSGTAPALAVQRAASAGKAAVLGRPYSAVSLRTVLYALLNTPHDSKLHGARHMISIGAFDAALDQYQQITVQRTAPEEHFTAGLEHLHLRQWDAALRSFRTAMQEISLRGDAELGMAAAWKGKGNESKYLEYMSRAAITFALAEKWKRARTTYIRLLRDDPAAESPFLMAVEKLVREQRFDAAAQALAEGYDITPESALRKMLATTFLASEAPDQQMRLLQRALNRTGMAAAGAGLSTGVRQDMYRQTRLQQARRASKAASSDSVAGERIRAQKKLLEHEGLAPLPHLQPRASDAPSLQQDAQTTTHATTLQMSSPTLEPLTESQSRSGLFTGIPGLNEALSVIKTTWQLTRRKS